MALLLILHAAHDTGSNINIPGGHGALFGEIKKAGTVADLTIEGIVSAEDAAGIAVTNNGNITNVKTA